MQVCGAKRTDAALWRRLGTDFDNRCEVDVSDLLSSARDVADGPRFYDLYYVDGVSPGLDAGAQAEARSLFPDVEDTPVLYPVPVVVKNLPENEDEAETLTRRFFVLDSQLGLASGTTSPAWVQYPKTAMLSIQVQLLLVCVVPQSHGMCTRVPTKTRQPSSWLHQLEAFSTTK